LHPADDAGISIPSSLPNLLSLRVVGVPLPFIQMPSLRRLTIMSPRNTPEKHLWKVLASAPHLESVHILGVLRETRTTHWRPEPKELPLKKLKELTLRRISQDAFDQLYKAVLLNNASLQSLELRSEYSMDLWTTLTLGPFVCLTILKLDVGHRVTPMEMMQLMNWMKQAPLVHTISVSTQRFDGSPGLVELFLGALLINPDKLIDNAICPRLTNITLDYGPVLPSLLLRTISQREVKSRDRIGISHDLAAFRTTLRLSSCSPKLGDGVLYRELRSSKELKRASLPEVRSFVNGIFKDVGTGQFDVAALSRISNPEERIRKLCSLLDLELPDV